MENTFPKVYEIIAENILRCAMFNTTHVVIIQKSCTVVYLKHERRVQSVMKLNLDVDGLAGHVYEVEYVEGRFYYKVDDIIVLIR